jgi:peptidoglycan L-alanyl-D-glutamate endopeptidase CwlK
VTFSFGQASVKRQQHVDPRLFGVGVTALARCTVDFGATENQSRTAAEQQKKFDDGFSKVQPGPGARHMIQPDGFSKAVDYVPWIDGKFQWGDAQWRVTRASGVIVLPFHQIALAMRSAAIEKAVAIRWGAVWDRRLNDLPSTVEGLTQEIEAYKARHVGPDFLDGPHFELI